MKTTINYLIPALFIGAAATVQAKEQPNVIYILADDLGYGDLQCYNAEGKIPTPNLDAMASNGVIFTDAHTSSAVSTPTRYGVLTGRYNWRSTLKSGVVSGYSKALIPAERTTLADVYNREGYSTAYIGKWHLGWNWKITAPDAKGKGIDDLSSNPEVDWSAEVENSPADLGFDYYYGFCGSLDMPPYVWVENDKVVTPPTFSTVGKGFGSWRQGPTSTDFTHDEVLQDVTDRTINYIKEKSSAPKKQRTPFFVYMPLPAPHTPILPTEQFLGKSKTNEYGDFVMQVDDVVGQIRKTLEEQGISDNTILIFTSDNGCSPRAEFEQLKGFGHSPNGELRGMKADLYEGGHRVPFIVEGSKGTKRGTKVDATICLTDMVATAADMVGSKLADNEGEDSFSFLSYLYGKQPKQMRDYTVHHSINGGFAIRQGEWKLLFAKGSDGWSYPTNAQIKKDQLNLPDFQLFNLADDISETTNLVDKYPAKVAELKAAMQKLITDGRSTAGAPQENDKPEGWWQIKKIFE
ncbi:MAG: arylsulfatase [Rikenellaceae bacterium]